MATIDGVWHPGIGDPSFQGWAIATGYFLGAATCGIVAVRAARRWSPQPSAENWRFWCALSGVLLLLAINKRFDLQMWLHHSSAALAKEEGWYQQRRGVQTVLIGVVGLCGAALTVSLLRLRHCRTGSSTLALAGVVFLVCFVVVRALSLHSLDRLLFSHHIGSWNPNQLLEGGGVSLVLASAAYGNWVLGRRVRP